MPTYIRARSATATDHDFSGMAAGAAGIVAWFSAVVRSWLRPSGIRTAGVQPRRAACWYDDSSASRGL